MDPLQGGGAGRGVEGDPGRDTPTQVGEQVHEDTPGGGDDGTLLGSRLGDVWEERADNSRKVHETT